MLQFSYQLFKKKELKEKHQNISTYFHTYMHAYSRTNLLIGFTRESNANILRRRT